ncbi:hypothetical protein HMPREF1210_02074 [Paenisporosarcina sp. HGH0030]|uniref:BsuPI-related putative proteinase inhibitor n=1 Tax=Paenisporosarcina sp. HGH0030 TaxID=1078085 RepID=UPI00034E25BF|nr:BsuPI-related putative proteinase inhibitor [Paenisporosarcina sp. HGH0030]EPD51476.1 hypothetical protein HMPREF1210_02074 [Paenisporosarcina sp. HGH0030]
MKNMLKVTSTAIILIALGGCGTSANSSESEEGNTGSGSKNNEIVAGSVVPSLSEESTDGAHQFTFQLRNDKEEDVKLSMNSSQLFDYQLIDSSDKVVYKDSENKMYAQMLQEKILKPGEILEMQFDATEGLSKLPAGKYTLEVWSTANEAEDWKASTEVSWNGTGSSSAGDKLKVEETSVTYVGLQDVNSIEVKNEQNEAEAMRLSETAKPFFAELEEGAKIKVFYVIIDGQKVIQSAEKE